MTFKPVDYVKKKPKVYYCPRSTLIFNRIIQPISADILIRNSNYLLFSIGLSSAMEKLLLMILCVLNSLSHDRVKYANNCSNRTFWVPQALN